MKNRLILKGFDKKFIEIAMSNLINYFKYIVRIDKSYFWFKNKEHELNFI